MVGDLLGQDAIASAMQQQTPPQAAPVTPEQHAENKGKWKAFLANFNDPNVRQALMQTGIGLMRSPGYGQSGWDIAANAVQTGVGTLQALREQDRLRAIQASDRAEKIKQQGIENTQKDKQLATGERNAAAYERQVSGQIDETRANRDEKVRAAKAKEEIDKYKAETDRMRAKAYSTGVATKVPADIQKIDMLAKQYMAEDPTMTDIEAKAKATELLAFGARNEPTSKVARDLYKQRLAAYTNSIEGLKNPPSAELQQHIMEEAQRDAQKLQSLNAAGGVPPTPGSPTIGPPGTSPTPPAATPTPGVPPGPSMRIADPAMQKKVEILKNRGLPPEVIKKALIDGGVDPTLYGL